MARGMGSTVKTGNRSWWVTVKNLEEKGYTVINSTVCHDICSDKWYNQVVFHTNDFNTPKTVLVRHAEGADAAAEKLGNKFPMILKTSTGSRGIGVMWIESLKSLHSVIQLLYREDQYVDIILQEYIKTDYDVRVIIVAGEVIGAIKRPVIEQDFRSNVSQGSEPEVHELTELERTEALRAAEAVDGQVVGVDFIPAKNREKEKPYMIEVNSTPGLMGIEAVFNSAASKPLIKDKKRSITKEILITFMNREHWKGNDNDTTRSNQKTQ
jgi:RimK family alpha-L-glutamate ligase